MKKSSLISIIVPMYNVSKYVGRCITSILEQSYSDIEIIVIDDGSTDDSYKICSKFAKEDERIILIHQKNKGLSGARNEGLRRASGEYVCFVDSDDYVREDFVKKLINAIIESNADIAVCGFNNVSPDNCVLSGVDATVRLLTKQENVDIVAWNKMYKASLFKDNGVLYPEGSNYEDSLTTYKLLSKANKVAFINDVLYMYEDERIGSITNKAKIEKSLDARERAAEESVQYFANDANLKQAAEIALLLSKFAYIDAAIKKKIDKKYLKTNEGWVRKNFKFLSRNIYLNLKLRIYILSMSRCGGVVYKVFRKII